MTNPLGLITKVVLASAGLAILIKYVAPTVPIPATAASALTLVFVPTLVLAAVLGWQTWQKSHFSGPR